MTRNNCIERTLLTAESTGSNDNVNRAEPYLGESERGRLIGEILDHNREIMREIHRGIPHQWLETEVTMPQFKTLMVLYGMGEATMGDLAEALGTGVSTVTGIIDRLVEHGLVLRVEDPRDRRVVVGRPTEAGVTLVDRLIGAARERMGLVLNRLSSDEIRHVAVCTRLLHHAAQIVFASSEKTSAESRSL
jgi:DNA-binding MarR family transcriptional regulator